MSVPAFLAAVQGRSADGARAALATTFQGKANGKPLDIDAQVRLLESFWMGFPDGNFTMEPTGGSGRHVITWTFSGTHDGLYLGVPPTGKTVTFSGYIISVSDRTGITSLDWKWDTKVFTRAVLGPDEVGELVVKDNFRDPSRRWAQGPPHRKGGKGKGRGDGRDGRQRQGGRPQGAPGQPAPQADGAQPTPGAAPGEAGQAPQPGEPRAPGKRRRRSRGKGRDPSTADGVAAAQGPGAGSAQPMGSDDSPASADPVDSAAGRVPPLPSNEPQAPPPQAAPDRPEGA